jgi:hypothetical protein
MKSLLVVCALASAAHADGWCGFGVKGLDESYALQVGIGASTGWRSSAELLVGFHLTDRVQLRYHERGTHEAEAAYGFRLTKVPWNGSNLRAKWFVLAGAGTGDETYVWGGAMVRVNIFDFVAVEGGGRMTSISANEVFASISLFLEPNH